MNYRVFHDDLECFKGTTMYHFKNLIKVGLASLLCSQFAFAMEEPRNSELWLRAAQNPLIPALSLPLNYTFHGGADNGDVSIGSIQPIFPVTLGNWNIINQLSLNFIGTSGVVNGIAELPEPYPGSGVAGSWRYGFHFTFFTEKFRHFLLGYRAYFRFSHRHSFFKHGGSQIPATGQWQIQHRSCGNVCLSTWTLDTGFQINSNMVCSWQQ